MKFEANFLIEPQLVFGGGNKFEDPKLGILTFGPYSISGKQPSPSEIRVGIIGSVDTVALIIDFLKRCKNEIANNSEDNEKYLSFPGFSKDSPFVCELQYDNEWIKTIDSGEIQEILKIKDDGERIAKAAKLFEEKMIQLKDNHPQPNVILCAIPDKIFETMATKRGKLKTLRGLKFDAIERTLYGFKKVGQNLLSSYSKNMGEPKLPEKGSTSLWRSLKVAAINVCIPVQLILPTFFNEELTENNATKAWNLFTALYYKSGGYPWKLSDLDVSTCYIGISFYRDLKVPDVTLRTALAQVFTPSGESLILKGDKIHIDTSNKSAHLKEDSAFKLLKNAISLYEQHRKHKPVRVVIHKTSKYSEEEIRGFKKALEGVQKCDFIAFLKRNLRYVRAGDNPPLRGTMIKLTERSILLYTHGYIPYLDKYRGSKVPEPLAIEYIGESPPEKICQEIMALTKLSWNSANFSLKYPLTIIFSRNVGSVLSEMGEGDDIKIENRYSFYM